MTLAYSLRAPDEDDVVGATEGAPLVFRCGRHEVPRGLEDAVRGRPAGERFEVDVSAEAVLGPRVEEPGRVLSADQLPAGVEPRVGAPIELDEDGERTTVWVTRIRNGRLDVTLEPPLAGRDVTLVATVLDVRAPGAAPRDEEE